MGKWQNVKRKWENGKKWSNFQSKTRLCRADLPPSTYTHSIQWNASACLLTTSLYGPLSTTTNLITKHLSPLKKLYTTTVNSNRINQHTYINHILLTSHFLSISTRVICCFFWQKNSRTTHQDETKCFVRKTIVPTTPTTRQQNTPKKCTPKNTMCLI